MNRQEFIRHLEKLGVEAVRIKLQSGAYGPDKLSVISQWLGESERQSSLNAEARKEASSREQIEIARSAKNAAWAAAIAAIIAAIAAVVSITLNLGSP